MIKVGLGYDVHKFAENRKLILGGVEIPYEKGLLGHSDADVLLHAIADALLGALALGDIGMHFPDTDDKFKNMDSMLLLKKVYDIVKTKGYHIGNIDSIIICEKPKLMNHILKMCDNIANCLETSINNISVKATTTETLGFEGRKEGIAAQAIVLLKRK
ncbi:MAG: 2-C-methyl-D-erythritol 2,4-cyclodiphosphate synthase [Candidatus Delongbacteria bacterium]|jgi:2-C-methyl-D-erythritol 2,4-cyclodiphosphate synthase|nr:2-C-methyl-D-erythritol 2,4-cyclodiphosphate synthase [Candidatus Delongbacteria bacterium]